MARLIKKAKRKNEYRHTKIGQLPVDWNVRKLGDISSKIGSGITPTGGESVYQRIGRPFIRSQNVGWGVLLLNDIAYIDEKTHKSFSSTEIKEDDILLNITGASIGRCAIADKRIANGNVNQHVCIIRLKEEVVPPFLAYFILSKKGQNLIDSYQAGGNRQGLNFEHIKSFLIPVPSVSEQQKIAHILSTCDKAIEKTEQLIAKKQQLKKGLMQKLLTGKLRFKEFRKRKLKNVVIEDVIQFSGGSQPPRSTFRFAEEGGYTRLIQNRDYKSDSFKTYIPTKLANKLCDENDIMIGRYGPPLFQLYRGLKGAYNVALIKAIPDETQILKDYCWYFLNRPELQKYIDGFSQRSGGQTGIEMDRLNSYPLRLPELDEQTRIVSALRAIDSAITHYRKQLHVLRNQKKGLMQNLLTGRVRVKT